MTERKSLNESRVTWRVLVAFPLYFALMILWAAAVFFGLLADKIAGKPYSKALTDV